jgi:hypothetical protein
LAKNAIPDPLERRHLIERPLDPARALAIAEAYAKEERVVEAVAFLRKANAADRLEHAFQQALREGDPFLLREVAQALGREPDVEAWRALESAAVASGKDRYAAEARRQVERLTNRQGG